MSAQLDHPHAHPRRWYVLCVLIVILLVVVLDNTVLNVALKTIARPDEGLGATQGQLQWSINSYTLVFAGLLFTFGVIGDRIGRKRILLIGMAIFGLSSLLSAYAQTPDQLIWARAAMGFGGAMVMPQTLSIIANVFPAHERARAIGLWAGAVGGGIAIGPITGGILLKHFWWGSVFLINVPVILLGLVAGLLLIPESRNPRPGKLDPVGVVLSVIGLVALIYGIIQGGDRASWLEPGVLGPIALGVVVLGVFTWYELRIDNPSLDIRLFRDPRLSAAVGGLTLVFFALSGVFFFMTFFLQSARGYSPLQAGALALPAAGGQILASYASSHLSKRYGAKLVCTFGLILVSVALFSYTFIGLETPIWTLEVGYFLQGAGMGLVATTSTEAVMSALPREKAGAGSALNNTARQVSVALGVAVLGSLVASLYRGRLKDDLAPLPAPMRESAGKSIEGTMTVAEKLGANGDRLVEPAHAAFVHAMHVTTVISSVIALLGALVVLKWMPGRDRKTPAEAVQSKDAEPAQV